MSKEAYGITTQSLNVGLSTVAGLSMMPNVVFTQFRQMAGTTLVVGAIGTAHASMFVAGAALSASLFDWTKIDGPSAIQFAAGGATATVAIIQGLGQGFSGQY